MLYKKVLCDGAYLWSTKRNLPSTACFEVNCTGRRGGTLRLALWTCFAGAGDCDEGVCAEGVDGVLWAAVKAGATAGASAGASAGWRRPTATRQRRLLASPSVSPSTSDISVESDKPTFSGAHDFR